MRMEAAAGPRRSGVAAGPGGGVRGPCPARPASLVLCDVSTLYFETYTGDGFREPGFFKQRRLEPQITIGLLAGLSFILGRDRSAGRQGPTRRRRAGPGQTQALHPARRAPDHRVRRPGGVSLDRRDHRLVH